jgi:glycosyltransferase involved in cell wall biosynthesis
MSKSHDAKQSVCGGIRTESPRSPNEGDPLITIVTVVYNGAADLERTILSVLGQTYKNIEYIVIDGGSTDETLGIIKQYGQRIDYWVSEPDLGIYDAMNKGIRLATGRWLNFLNASDSLFQESTIANVVDRYIRPRRSNEWFFYSDVILSSGSPRRPHLVRHTCNHTRKIINHQAAVYAKELHERHGLYLVAPGVTVSDYLFFCSIDVNAYVKIHEPIAVYDVTGVSQSRRSVEQKFIIDYLINGDSRLHFIMYFLFYFYYRQLKITLTSVRTRASQLRLTLITLFRRGGSPQ